MWLQAVTSLAAGESFTKGQTMTSSDGQSKLVFQGDGNIVVGVPLQTCTDGQAQTLSCLRLRSSMASCLLCSASLLHTSQLTSDF